MFVTILKRTLLYGGGTVFLFVVAVLAWQSWPLSIDENRPDPAVIIANEMGSDVARYEEGYVGDPGTRTHYVSAGEGDAIIFVHGFPSYWFTMFGLMEAFKPEYQVIAFDGLGVGRSDAPASVEAYKLEYLVRSIEQVVAEFDLDHVHLVGHDWGVALSVAYAQAYPEKVRSVTAIGALPHNVLLARLEHDEAHRERFSYTSDFARANPFLIKVLGVKEQLWRATYAPLFERGLLSDPQAERLKKDLGNPKRLNRFIHWYRANLLDYSDIDDGDYWPSKTARLSVPSIFIYGSEDPVVTDALVEDFQAISDAMEVLKLKDIGHRPHFEDRDTVVTAIRNLIERSETVP